MATPAQRKLSQLRECLAEIDDLRAAAALLHWDQLTYMPLGGASARGRQMATLSRLAHEKFIDPAIGELLDELRTLEESLPGDHDDAALIRVVRRDYERKKQMPPEFTAELTLHQTKTYAAWIEARPENDFHAVAPLLQKTIDLSRQLAEFFPGYEHVADPLIDFADEAVTVGMLRGLFADLRKEVAPLVEKIAGLPEADDTCLRQTFPEKDQYAFARDVIARYGYDFERGRYDKTPHPFQTKFSLGDVRITTRSSGNFLSECIFSMFHEAGHAIYEQGINPSYEATPLAEGASAGLHESQSRLWENLVGRSRIFWECFYPRLLAMFPSQLQTVPLETFYRAINSVRPSLIRVEADELTYNLHVIIRFDLECAMLEGNLTARDLPDAWKERYRADLGLTPPDDRNGCMQDVHWYYNIVGGMFQCYTLGNILGAQFFAKAVEESPTVPTEMSQGRFATLHEWLHEKIYQHGRKYTASELAERVTGAPMSIAPYARYLHRKYGELYGI